MRLCDATGEHAALVVVLHPDRKRVLAISSDHDVSDWGFPGGGAEPHLDTTVEDTAYRELWEESGVVAGLLIPIDRRHSGKHCATTFLAETIRRWPERLESVPFEGHVAWVEPARLIAPTCRYRQHATEMLQLVGLID